MQPNYQRAKKSLGQNFLIDPNYQHKISDTVARGYKGETVIEIGPGKGAITQHLVGFAKKLILIEKDYDLAPKLKEQFKDNPNVTVFQGDFLEFDFAELTGTSNIVIGNLPYNVASQIFIRLLENHTRFQKLYLMFQKEVALRCVAKPSTKDYGILTIWTELFSKARLLFDVPPNAFSPRPKITSSFVEFITTQTGSYTEEKAFIQFVRKVFGQRRKKISTITKAQLPEIVSEDLRSLVDQRAEALLLEELKKVFVQLKE